MSSLLAEPQPRNYKKNNLESCVRLKPEFPSRTSIRRWATHELGPGKGGWVMWVAGQGGAGVKREREHRGKVLYDYR